MTSGFTETIFHEGTHLLFSRESLFRSAIFFRSEELEIPFDRNLWHASLFYLCGRTTEDLLRKNDIEHDLIMDKKNVFKRYNTSEFRTILEAYYQKENDLKATVDLLLKIKK